MNKIKLTSQVKHSANQTSKLKLVVHFDDGDSIDLLFNESQEEEVLELKKIYEDWSNWCNLKLVDVVNLLMPYFKKYLDDKEYTEDLNEEELTDYFNNFVPIYWSWSTEYKCYAKCYGTTLTYFDQDGIEWNVEIEPNKQQ